MLAKVSPPNTAWTANVASRTTISCAAANGAPAATSQEIAAQERAFVGLASAKMATVQSSFLPLLPREFLAPARRSLFPHQRPFPAALAPTDLAAVPTSTFAKARHSATAVARQDTVVRLLVTARQAARHPSAHVQTPACLPTEPAEVSTSTNAKDLDSAIAAVVRATAVPPPVTVQRDARLDSGPARPPTSRQMALAEVRTDTCAKAPRSATAAVLLGTAVLPPGTAPRAVKPRLAHALLLTFRLMARVAGQTSTSVKGLATATAAVPADTVGRQRIIVLQAVKLVLVLAPR